ncbi:MAG: translocation/assembly module TamB domain-containing protein [Tannerella sp.]|jgi:hypothetical protein|nr:translocation/assembly module TamB domain-containing protein [Tannerella sp.]
MRAWLKRTGIVILIPAVILMLVSGLVYVPSVQRAAARKAVEYVSESFGINIRFERLRLSFPLNLSAHKVSAIGSGGDTLLCLDRMTLRMRLMPLLRGTLSVGGIRLEKAVFNTGSLIDGVVVRGYAGEIFLRADSVSPADAHAVLDRVTLSDADIGLFACDTAAVAAAETAATGWYIGLKRAELRNVAFTCRMPCDSLYLDLRVDRALLSGGATETGKGSCEVSDLLLDVPELSYGTDDGEAAPGFDPSHIRISGMHLRIDSFLYESGKSMRAILRECEARERSGAAVRSAAGRIASDSAGLHIPSFAVRTDYSHVQLQADVPWAAVDSVNPGGDLSVGLSVSAGREDLLLFAGGLPEDFRLHYPDAPLRVELSAGGNVAHLALKRFMAHLPGAFLVNLTGDAKAVADERLRAGTVRCSVETHDLNFAAALLSPPLQERFRVPDSMRLAGEFTVGKGVHAADLVIRESGGRVKLSGKYSRLADSYEACLEIDSLEPVHFMPGDSVMFLCARACAKGQGTNPRHPSTWAELEGEISEIRYGRSSIPEISLTGNLRNGRLQAVMKSAWPLVRGQISVEGDIDKNGVRGTLTADVDTLDFRGLNLTETPLATSFRIFSEVESDLEKTHALDVTLGNWSMVMDRQTVQPGMLTLAVRSGADTVRASLRAGDLEIMLTGNAGLNVLAGRMAGMAEEAVRQLRRDSMPDVQALLRGFPDMALRIRAGRSNLLSDFVQEYGLFFDAFDLDAGISPENGLRVDGSLLALVKDTLKIDTVRLSVWQDTLGLGYRADVSKNRFRNQEAFRADARGHIRGGDAGILASYVDGGGREGLYLGLNIRKVPGGFRLQVHPGKTVIAFLPFAVNSGNYFLFRSMADMEADLRMESDSTASVWIHSGEGGRQAKELMVELSRIDLGRISGRFAGLPALKGMLNATLRYEPEETSFMIVADGDVDDLFYEGGRIGNLLANATYMPLEKGRHQIDMHVFHDMSEIASLSVLYREGRRENTLDGAISIDRLPLSMFNAMIPDGTARLDGFLLGSLSVAGTDSNPLASGTLRVENGSAYVVPSSTALHFDDRTVTVTGNRVSLDKYCIYTLKENPLVIDGFIDATNTARPTASLKVSATNLLLVDAKKTPGSLAYGRLSVNMNTTLTGPLQALRMRGSVHVAGSTNLTCVIPGSLPEARDGFSNLVTFSYFADTLPRRTRRPFDFVNRTRRAAAAGGTDVFVNVRIDPTVRLRVNMDEEQSNFVELRGGGELLLQYPPQDGMRLNGRYTLSDGTIRYSIPVIPLTDFSVRNGSYVDWTGDPMNPALNITAHTRVRTAVEVDGQKKMVDFNAGIELRNRLEDIAVRFVLEAPSEAVVQNQLTSMGEEERGKQAVSLLVTGVYLAGGGAGGDRLDVGQALSSLLQREIKNMLGSLLGDVPFSFDVETYDGTQQGMGRRVDYTGRFYRSFLGERLNTALGFRYSTNDPLHGNSFFLDDISLKYVPDANGERAVSIFRSKEYENLFEGEIVKTGAEFTINRKVKRFGDLFFPRRRREAAVAEDGDARGGREEAPAAAAVEEEEGDGESVVPE